MLHKLLPHQRYVILRTAIMVGLFALNEHFPGNSVSTSVATQLKLSPVVIGGIVKALPALSLALNSLVCALASKYTSKMLYGLAFTVALLFCALGDYFLYLEAATPDTFFIHGLGSFLIAHVILSLSFYFRLLRLQDVCKTYVPQSMSFDVVPYLVFIYGGIFFKIMSVNLMENKELLQAVALYCFMIAFMFFMALWNHRLEKRVRHIVEYEPKEKGHLNTILPRWRAPGYLIGSVLFVISDSFIGYGKFVDTDETANYSFQILSTYFIAITFLCISSTDEPMLPSNTKESIGKKL